MKILILEDEIPAYQKLLGFVTEEIPQAKILGWARSIQEAKLLLKNENQPDLIFSDIELLDGISFTIFEDIKVNCPIIFCTAFDQYVLKAFKTNGIAYLLKPYTIENFREAIEKYNTLFEKKETQTIDIQLIQEMKMLLDHKQKAYKERFAIKKKEGIKLLKVDDIVLVEANGDFCVATDINRQKNVINHTLSQIEEKLNPASFFRINRSQIINIDFVEKIEPHFKNRLSIKMKSAKEQLLTSSSKTPEFRKWIEGG